MPGVLLGMELGKEDVQNPRSLPPNEGYGFVVIHQKLDLEIDFSTRMLKGRTEIKILPETKDLSIIKIDARQCSIPADAVKINGFEAEFGYEDPYKAVIIPPQFAWNASNWQQQKNRLKGRLVEIRPGTGALEITIPEQVSVVEVDPFSGQADAALTGRAAGASAARASLDMAPLSTTSLTPKSTAEQSSKFQPLVVSVTFATEVFRDGLHFVGLNDRDVRYPHVYTLHSIDPGTASCIFPCIDDASMRCSWDISIKCSRTLGDALKRHPVERKVKSKHFHVNGVSNGITNGAQSPIHADALLTDQEKLMEMVVVCSGEQLTETVDFDDSSKKIVSYRLTRIVAPQHIGFAIGPFEQVDLAEFRDVDDDEKLGQGQAIDIYAYCLPGRLEELRHTCSPMASALDYFLLTFGTFPFPDCKLVFVEDLRQDTAHTASLAFCSTRLLFGQHILDPEIDITRKIVHTIASQWVGVSIVPSEPQDRWVAIGISYYMTDLFMKVLCGNNELAFRLKEDMDSLVQQDINRPNLLALGAILGLGSFEYDFMALKAPLVLYILDKRIIKAQGSLGIQRVISKLIVNANTSEGSEGFLTTESFRKLCEKTTKYRETETFWNNYIYGAGLPRLSCNQRYNRKKTCLEFTYTQTQLKDVPEARLEKNTFWRDTMEFTVRTDANSVQPIFKGSMTIRIHGADGTPYDHIIDINKDSGKVEINYNTKYKRLKRSRRAKERANAGNALDVSGESQDDVLIYCLGDVLQSPEDAAEWHLAEWSPEQEQDMEQESYEWLRADADFEWLCEKKILGMPPYMFISQLQQDRDVVAQHDSMKYLMQAHPHPLVATFLVRTLMDRRYFYGIRSMAAEYLKNQTGEGFLWQGMKHLEKAFQEFFCYPGTKAPRPNDFTDKQAYLIECSISRAMSQIRGSDGKCPREARHFILDQLRFNDNRYNEYSDDFKVANLLSALAESLVPAKTASNQVSLFDDDEEEDQEWTTYRDDVLRELDRHGRIDEWDMSYQNILTVTVIECKQKLMKEKVMPFDPLEFARYLHDGTADIVRIKSFEALADLGYLRQSSFSSLLIYVMSTDTSPYVRKRLFDVFTIGLATLASGEHKPTEQLQVAAEDGLIIEQEAVLKADIENKKFALARKTNIVDALAALKDELQGDELFKEAVWDAVKSPVITAPEQMELLNLCLLLYDSADKCILNIPLPRYWTVRHCGHCKLHFKRDGRFRPPKLRTPPNPPTPPTVSLSAPPKPGQIRLSVKKNAAKVFEKGVTQLHAKDIAKLQAKDTTMPPSTKIMMKPPPKRPQPHDADAIQGRESERPRKIVKLRLGEHAQDAEIIQSKIPHPAKAKKKAATRTSQSPVPKASSKPLPARAGSPPSITTCSSLIPNSQPPASTNGTPTVKIRKPLPDSSRKPLPGSGPAITGVPAPAPPDKKPSKIKFTIKRTTLPS